MEADDSAVSRSAHLMVGTLAGSLAHVTSKVILLKVFKIQFAGRNILGLLFSSIHVCITCMVAYSIVLSFLQEPLRVALSSHLRSLIQGITNNTESTEQIMLILVNDNLDLGCALIETVATRKVGLYSLPLY